MTVRARRVERGSALIVALVFLVILTILGLSTMTTSRLELKMASNAQFADLAYQAAESGIDLTLATPSIKTVLPDDPSDPPLAQSFTVGGQSVATETRVVTEGGLIEGFGARKFGKLHYEIDSLGTGPGGGEARHMQGFYIIIPKGE